MGEDNDPKRRDILKGIGGAGVGFSLLSNSASANPLREGEITLLEGPEKSRIAGEFSRSQAFHVLRKRATANSDRKHVSFAADGVMVGRRRTQNMAREVVQFPLQSVEDASYAAIIIGRNIDSHNIEFAWLDYYHETDDGILSQVRRISYPAERGKNVSEGVAHNDQAFTTGTTSGMEDVNEVSDHSEQIIDVDVDLVREAKRNAKDSGRSTVQAQSSDLSTQAVPDLCDWCNFAVGTVCTTVCGGVGGFACGFFAITVPIAGVSCLTFVTVVCGVADIYSGCGAAVAEVVCDDKFNVC